MPDELKIFEEFPALKKKPELFQNILLELEKNCIAVAVYNLSPQTTRFYYNRIIVNICESINENHKELYNAAGIELTDEERDIVGGIVSQKYISTKLVDTLEKILKKRKIKFPSYKTVLGTIERLGELGIFKKREVEGTNASFYWILNPDFIMHYDLPPLKIFSSVVVDYTHNILPK